MRRKTETTLDAKIKTLEAAISGIRSNCRSWVWYFNNDQKELFRKGEFELAYRYEQIGLFVYSCTHTHIYGGSFFSGVVACAEYIAAMVEEGIVSDRLSDGRYMFHKITQYQKHKIRPEEILKDKSGIVLGVSDDGGLSFLNEYGDDLPY